MVEQEQSTGFEEIGGITELAKAIQEAIDNPETMRDTDEPYQTEIQRMTQTNLAEGLDEASFTSYKPVDLSIFHANLAVAPKLVVGIAVSSTTKQVEELKAYLSRFKIGHKVFSDSFGDPALAHIFKSCCMVLVSSGSTSMERKVLASGRYVLRLSGSASPCPYVYVANFKNLTHTIMEAKRQLSKSTTPQLIAKYSISNLPL